MDNKEQVKEIMDITEEQFCAVRACIIEQYEVAQYWEEKSLLAGLLADVNQADRETAGNPKHRQEIAQMLHDEIFRGDC